MTTSPLPRSPYAAGFEKFYYPSLELQILALQDSGKKKSRFLRAPKPPSQILKQFLLS